MQDPTYYNFFTSGCYKFYWQVTIPDNEQPVKTISSYPLPYKKFSDTKISIANTLPQTLFSFQKVSTPNADMGLKLTRDYQCQLD
ncbi:MAG: hypothetical protein ACOYN2_03875 [Patescibacteria group bacterium]